MGLPEDDRRKLAGVLARLASEHAGERAAAALLACRILAKHQKRPEDLLNGKGGDNGGPYAGFERTVMDRLLRENQRLQDELRTVRRGGSAHAAVIDELRQRALQAERAGAKLRSELSAARAALAEAQHQANPDAYQTPPWEDEKPKPRGRGKAAAEAEELLIAPGVRWTDWEKEFLTSMSAWRGAPTDRQEEVMEKLRAKVAQAGAARKAAAGIWG